jgi:hypothetical protein
MYAQNPPLSRMSRRTVFDSLDPKKAGSISFTLPDGDFKRDNYFTIQTMYAPDRSFENRAQCNNLWREAIKLGLMTRNMLECVFKAKPEPPVSKIIPTLVATPTPVMMPTAAPTPAVTSTPVMMPTSSGLPTRPTRLALGAPKARGPPRIRGPKLEAPKVYRLSGPKGLGPTKLGCPQGPQMVSGRVYETKPIITVLCFLRFRFVSFTECSLKKQSSEAVLSSYTV